LFVIPNSTSTDDKGVGAFDFAVVVVVAVVGESLRGDVKNAFAGERASATNCLSLEGVGSDGRTILGKFSFSSASGM
jgi:hypothetical protein